MLPLVMFYHRLNKYSFNALAGALDRDDEASATGITRAKTADEVRAAAAGLLSRHERILVALSIMTPQLREAESLVRQLRAAHGTRIIFLAGGPHATADPEGVLRLGINLVFRGESEAIFPAALKNLARRESCLDIPGIAFRDGGKLLVNPRPEMVDIDSFDSFSAGRGMFGPIEITRGCPFACSYCQTSHIFGVRPRHRSVDNIVRQALALRSSRKRNVRLLSPNAFSYGSPDGRQLNLAAIGRLLESLRRALDPGDQITFAHFPSEVRPEHVSVETLELMRAYANNDEIVIGAQTGSQRMLDACRRSHDVGSILNAVRLARKFGYRVIVDFILGLPGETPEDVRETVAVIREIARLGGRIHPHAFVPLPQTAFAAERPGKIPAEVTRTLAELKSQRAVYGDWVPQRRLAHRVYRGLRGDTGMK